MATLLEGLAVNDSHGVEVMEKSLLVVPVFEKISLVHNITST